jgi:hypothetical protein
MVCQLEKLFALYTFFVFFLKILRGPFPKQNDPKTVRYLKLKLHNSFKIKANQDDSKNTHLFHRLRLVSQRAFL